MLGYYFEVEIPSVWMVTSALLTANSQTSFDVLEPKRMYGGQKEVSKIFEFNQTGKEVRLYLVRRVEFW